MQINRRLTAQCPVIKTAQCPVIKQHEMLKLRFMPVINSPTAGFFTAITNTIES